MKNIASILLLIILLFNFIGYRMLSSVMEEHANNRLEAQLDNNDYDDAQLISIKIPVTHLAYYNSSEKFERANGEVELNGIQYKFVKRRIYNDSVEMLCIPNQNAMSLQSAKDEFFKLVNDLQHTGQSKKTDSHSSKNFSVDNYTLSESFRVRDVFYFISVKRFSYPVSLQDCPIAPAGQPPEMC